MKNAMVVVPTASRKLISQAVNTAVKAANKWVKTAEQLHEDGVTSDMVGTGYKSVCLEFYNDVRAAIVEGLPAPDQRLINADIKEMAAKDKPARKAAQQKIGRYQDLLAGYLRGFEHDAKDLKSTSTKTKGKQDKPAGDLDAKDLERILKRRARNEKLLGYPRGFRFVESTQNLKQEYKALTGKEFKVK